MNPLLIIQGLLGAAKAIAKTAEKAKALEAGMALAAIRAIDRGNEVIDDAISAAEAVRDDPDSDYAKRLYRKYSAGAGGE